jgi:hypothetical protein
VIFDFLFVPLDKRHTFSMKNSKVALSKWLQHYQRQNLYREIAINNGRQLYRLVRSLKDGAQLPEGGRGSLIQTLVLNVAKDLDYVDDKQGDQTNRELLKEVAPFLTGLNVLNVERSTSISSFMLDQLQFHNNLKSIRLRLDDLTSFNVIMSLPRLEEVRIQCIPRCRGGYERLERGSSGKKALKSVVIVGDTHYPIISKFIEWISTPHLHLESTCLEYDALDLVNSATTHLTLDFRNDDRHVFTSHLFTSHLDFERFGQLSQLNVANIGSSSFSPTFFSDFLANSSITSLEFHDKNGELDLVDVLHITVNLRNTLLGLDATTSLKRIKLSHFGQLMAESAEESDYAQMIRGSLDELDFFFLSGELAASIEDIIYFGKERGIEVYGSSVTAFRLWSYYLAHESEFLDLELY